MSTLKIVFHVVFRQHQNTSYARSHISEIFIEKNQTKQIRED